MNPVAQVDVYAFGCILYELVARVLLLFTETPANSAEDCEAYAGKIAQGYRPKKPNACPDDIWQLVQSCWAQQPDARPTAAMVRTQVEQLLRSRTAGAPQSREGDAPPLAHGDSSTGCCTIA